MALFNGASENSPNEWYTPTRYINAAREVMGTIHLDPASCKLANTIVQAETFYTKEENGLLQPWKGNIWLNPPFGKDYSISHDGRGRIGRWVEKLVREYQQGNVTQAILLAPTTIEASWFQWMWEYHICFVNHEVRFYSPSGKRKFHLFGTVFVYFGPEYELFIELFKRFGSVVTPSGVQRMPLSFAQSSFFSREEEVDSSLE